MNDIERLLLKKYENLENKVKEDYDNKFYKKVEPHVITKPPKGNRSDVNAKRGVRMFSATKMEKFTSKQQAQDKTRIDIFTITTCINTGGKEFYSGWGEMVNFELVSI